jgi:hypothetical protein
LKLDGSAKPYPANLFPSTPQATEVQRWITLYLKSPTLTRLAQHNAWVSTCYALSAAYALLPGLLLLESKPIWLLSFVYIQCIPTSANLRILQHDLPGKPGTYVPATVSKTRWSPSMGKGQSAYAFQQRRRRSGSTAPPRQLPSKQLKRRQIMIHVC